MSNRTNTDAEIANRLTTSTRAKFLEKLTGRAALAFTSSNAYAVVIWAIKNANQYFGEQTVELYKALSTYENVLRYKSNIRTWVNEKWRYVRDDVTHYSLDYRIVIEGHRAICLSWRYDHPQNLYRGCHSLIADVIAVLYNLGFPSQSPTSMDRTWYGGEWQDWYRLDGETVLFQVKAYKNGNLHMRFLPEAIRALNVEAGRLLGWLKSAEEVVEELGYTKEEAGRLFNSTNLIGVGSVRLMLGDGTE